MGRDAGGAVGALFVLAISLGFAALVFLLGRALVLWYWRVNEAVTSLQAIEKHLERIARQGGGSRTDA